MHHTHSCQPIHFVLAMGILLGLGACAPRQITLFSQSETPAQTYSLPAVPPFLITPGDELNIVFAGPDEQTVSPLNMAANPHTVASDGSITLPVLGRFVLQGMSIEQAEKALTKAAQTLLKDPIVQLQITNAHISIIGEVQNPGTFVITQPLPLLTALGMAGDLLPNARRDNLLVQRTVNGQMYQYRINLLTDELFSSPCFYLQKGDIVYVSPRYDRP